jgi:hypothetical protein
MFQERNQPPVEGRLNEWEIPLGGDARHKATCLPERYADDVSVDFLGDFPDRVRKESGDPELEAWRMVWVHGLRDKLYDDGRFYDLELDPAEARRIPPGEGSPEANAARRRLQAVLDAHARQAGSES